MPSTLVPFPTESVDIMILIDEPQRLFAGLGHSGKKA